MLRAKHPFAADGGCSQGPTKCPPERCDFESEEKSPLKINSRAAIRAKAVAAAVAAGASEEDEDSAMSEAGESEAEELKGIELLRPAQEFSHLNSVQQRVHLL